MQDRDGREYAKLTHLKNGDFIELDSGFTCHPPGIVLVRIEAGRLYFDCDKHKHYLDGQLADDGDSLVGIYSERKGEK